MPARYLSRKPNSIQSAEGNHDKIPKPAQPAVGGGGVLVGVTLALLWLLGPIVTAAYAQAPVQCASLTLGNNVGDVVSGTFELTSSDPFEDWQPGQGLSERTCANMNGIGTCTANVPVPFQFAASQANMTLKGFITVNADGDESCTIAASASAAPPPPPPPPPDGLCPYVPLENICLGARSGGKHPGGAAQRSAPAAGGDNCNLVIMISDSGAVVRDGSATYPYDSYEFCDPPIIEGEDILVGVVNNSKLNVGLIGLDGGSNPIFAFDGDGINTYLGEITNGIPIPNNGMDDSDGGYGGPGTYFTNIHGNAGVAKFINPIPPGGSTYFSLQSSAKATACGNLIQPFSGTNGTFSGPNVNGPEITASFTPSTSPGTVGISGTSSSLLDAATVCGFTNFDWEQKVTNLPHPPNIALFGIDNPNTPLTVPFNDPPPGGLEIKQFVGPFGLIPKILALQPKSSFPFYYDPDNKNNVNASGPGHNLQDHETDTTLNFYDAPNGDPFLLTTAVTPPCGANNNGLGPIGPISPNDYMAFETHLVGVNGRTPTGLGKSFKWCSTWNGTSGGVSLLENSMPPDPGSGYGGVTILSIDDMSDFQGIALTSVNGLPVGGVMLPGGSTAPTQTLNDGKSCDGAFNGIFNGNITVSEGQNCTFANGTINGNVIVKGGLLALYEDTVNGNVQIQAGEGFTIASYTTINGNLQVQKVPTGGAPNYVCDSVVNGNLQVHNNQADVQVGSLSPARCGTNGVSGNLQANNNAGAVSIVANSVDGNLQINNNTGAANIFFNAANGNLQCQNNPLISWSGNTAKQKQGQCTGL